MIAAGVADRVGLSLTVLAESRIEAMNFPNGQCEDSDFTYDWSAPPRDLGRVFLDAFNARNATAGNRLWLTESAMGVTQANLARLANFFPRRTGFGDGGAGSGASAADDVEAAFAGLGPSAIATRLRADLPARMLDRDLDLAASDRELRDRTYRFGRELNRPMYSVCPWPGQPERPPVSPADDAGAPDGAALDGGALDGGALDGGTPAPQPHVASGGMQCAAARPGADADGAALAIGALALAGALRRARRRR
jgi:hypothetical protein